MDEQVGRFTLLSDATLGQRFAGANDWRWCKDGHLHLPTAAECAVAVSKISGQTMDFGKAQEWLRSNRQHAKEYAALVWAAVDDRRKKALANG